MKKKKKINSKDTNKERENINRHTVTGKRGKQNNHRNSARKSLQFNRLTECFISSHAHNSNVCILYCFLAHFRVSIRSNEHLLLFQCCLPQRLERRFLSVLFLSQFDHLKFNFLHIHELFLSLAKPLPISNVEASVSIFILYANCYCCFLIKIYDIKTYCSYESLFVFDEIKLSFRLATLWHPYKDRTRAAQMLNVV